MDDQYQITIITDQLIDRAVDFFEEQILPRVIQYLPARFQRKLVRPNAFSQSRVADNYFHHFEALHLKKRDINAFYGIFLKVDQKREHVISSSDFLMFLDLERTGFTKRVFKNFDVTRQGKIDFYTFVITIWNYCTLSHAALVTLAFDIYDIDNRGMLFEKEMKEMITDLFGDGYEKNKHAVELRESMLSFAGRGDRGVARLDMADFRSFIRRSPTLLFPAFDVQRRMQRLFLGKRFWRRCARVRLNMTDQEELRVERLLHAHVSEAVKDHLDAAGHMEAEPVRLVYEQTGPQHHRGKKVATIAEKAIRMAQLQKDEEDLKEMLKKKGLKWTRKQQAEWLAERERQLRIKEENPLPHTRIDFGTSLWKRWAGKKHARMRQHLALAQKEEKLSPKLEQARCNVLRLTPARAMKPAAEAWRAPLLAPPAEGWRGEEGPPAAAATAALAPAPTPQETAASPLLARRTRAAPASGSTSRKETASPPTKRQGSQRGEKKVQPIAREQTLPESREGVQYTSATAPAELGAEKDGFAGAENSLRRQVVTLTPLGQRSASPSPTREGKGGASSPRRPPPPLGRGGGSSARALRPGSARPHSGAAAAATAAAAGVYDDRRAMFTRMASKTFPVQAPSTQIPQAWGTPPAATAARPEKATPWAQLEEEGGLAAAAAPVEAMVARRKSRKARPIPAGSLTVQEGFKKPGKAQKLNNLTQQYGAIYK